MTIDYIDYTIKYYVPLLFYIIYFKLPILHNYYYVRKETIIRIFLQALNKCA